MEEKIVENQNVTVMQRVLQHKKYIIEALGIIVLIFLLFLSYLAVIAAGSEVYPNVSIMDANVGGLKKDAAIKKLEKVYSNAENAKLILKVGNRQVDVKFKELGVKYDFNKAVENAYNLASEGSISKRLFDVATIKLKGKTLDLPISYDSQVLEDKLKQFEDDQQPAKDDTYEIKNGKLIVYYGKTGRGIDKDAAVKKIEDMLKKGIDGELIFEKTNIKPKALTAEAVSVEPKDASIKVMDYKEIKYVPEVYGAKFDKDTFNKLYKENMGKESFSMNVEVIEPELTLSRLKSKLFSDTLAVNDTYFGTSTQNRKHNVQLAASKVGGIILGPGDEFSYNKIVGPRTADKGFQMAHVYSNGTVIDDYGGGICQVSTTLYGAVLQADLNVTQRSNHMFTVGYAKPGLDATVSYGSIDFKFKNNTKWPIKIVNSTTSTNVHFTLLGTNTEPEKTVEFRRDVVKVLPFNTITTLDSTLPKGKVVTDQSGSDGYVVNVYKIIKRNGVVEKEEFMHKDTYQPLSARVRKGTKQIQQEVKPPEPPDTSIKEPIDETPNTDNSNQNSNTNLQTEPLVPVINQDNAEAVEE